MKGKRRRKEFLKEFSSKFHCSSLICYLFKYKSLILEEERRENPVSSPLMMTCYHLLKERRKCLGEEILPLKCPQLISGSVSLFWMLTMMAPFLKSWQMYRSNLTPISMNFSFFSIHTV